MSEKLREALADLQARAEIAIRNGQGILDAINVARTAKAALAEPETCVWEERPVGIVTECHRAWIQTVLRATLAAVRDGSPLICPGCGKRIEVKE